MSSKTSAPLELTRFRLWIDEHPDVIEDAHQLRVRRPDRHQGAANVAVRANADLDRGRRPGRSAAADELGRSGDHPGFIAPEEAGIGVPVFQVDRAEGEVGQSDQPVEDADQPRAASPRRDRRKIGSRLEWGGSWHHLRQRGKSIRTEDLGGSAASAGSRARVADAAGSP